MVIGTSTLRSESAQRHSHEDVDSGSRFNLTLLSRRVIANGGIQLESTA